MKTVNLEIGGMTCASCASRIAKRLNELDGVDAQVNYATEHATITVGDDTATDVLIAQVESVGYTARIPQRDDIDDDRDLRALRNRVVVSTALAIPVLLLS